VPSWVPFFGKEDKHAQLAASGDTRADAPASARDGRPKPAPTSAPAGQGVIIDRVVAVVNNDAITLGELQETVAVYRHENRNKADVRNEDLRTRFLDRLIETRLQLQEAEREKITVEESEVNDELAERMKKAGVTREEDFESALKAQGLSLEAVKKRLRDSIKVARLVRRKVALRVSVTDAEIEEYLEEHRAQLESGLTYHARHILIAPDPPTDAGWEQARIRADTIRARLEEGADFAEMARQYSRDVSARDGGDLGTLRRGELAQEIEQQILALAPGQVSAPYRSAIGWHIFQLESKESL